MEMKSIGTFIAVLRRVNGMTQKDLADRLGVSDKTVSHWERDESAPDLTLIPMIAEVFGITCDELLRCERIRNASEEPSVKESSVKTERQAKNLLGASRNKFKRRSMISLGLSILGLLAALVFGGSNAYVAFLIGCIFYMSAAICESIFYSYALYAAGGDDFSGSEMNDYKMYVVHLAGKVISAPVVMFAASLALIIYSYNAYDGISAVQWLAWGLIAAPVAAVVCMFTVYIVNNALIKKGVFALIKSDDIKRHNVNRLKVLCITAAVAILFALFLGQMAFNRAVGPEAFMAGVTFNNCDDFKAYMETENVIEGLPEDDSRPAVYGTGEGYFDEYGNLVSREQALTDYVYDDAGNILCRYVRLNPEVGRITYNGAGTGEFSVITYTYEQLIAGQSVSNLINTAWVGSYFIVAGVVFLIYFKKRVKLG